MTRTPAEMRTTRMGPLSRLPAFFALDDKRAVVAGGSAAAAWKAELLSAAGARVDIFAPAPGDDLRALAAAPSAGAVIVHERGWQAADFAGAALAVGDCADDAEAAQFAAAARAAGVPVNVVDRPAFCDFSFGAIVNRSPLVIGISTDGAAPVFGQAIRAKIEALIPKGFARWADAARTWRPHVQALALPFRGRRHFWERFTDRAVAAPEHDAERSRPRRVAGAGRRARRRLGGSGRRRPGRSGAVDVARGARAAIRRGDLVRRAGRAGDPRLRPSRGAENAGRQDRPWALLPPGRYQCADGLARQGWTARGAAQGRRPDDLRPRRRGDRRLPRRRRRGRSGAGRDGGPRRREPACGLADAPGKGPPRAIRHRPRPQRRACRRISTGKASPIRP